MSIFGVTLNTTELVVLVVIAVIAAKNWTRWARDLRLAQLEKRRVSLAEEQYAKEQEQRADLEIRRLNSGVQQDLAQDRREAAEVAEELRVKQERMRLRTKAAADRAAANGIVLP